QAQPVGGRAYRPGGWSRHHGRRHVGIHSEAAFRRQGLRGPDPRPGRAARPGRRPDGRGHGHSRGQVYPSGGVGALSKPKTITVLGSTGSVGTSTLDLASRAVAHGSAEVQVIALTAGANVALLAEQALEWRPKIAVIADERLLSELRQRLKGSGVACAAGKAAGGVIIPVDSEHSAIFQVLDPTLIHRVAKLIITASGGPFRDWSRAAMGRATPEQAVAHPNFRMGAKISVDSATMMNKGLEMIEARYLFGVTPEQIEVLIHPEQIIHSMVEYRDGSTLAPLCAPATPPPPPPPPLPRGPARPAPPRRSTWRPWGR